MNRSFRPFLAALALWLGPSFPGAQAAPPATLALKDLAQRPDRWPATVKLKRDFQFSGGGGARAGQSVRVLEFNGGAVVADAGNELVFEVAPAECDLLEAANLAWTALTPAQRAIEPQTLLADASLWPARVKCLSGFQLEDGTILPAGGEYDLLLVDAAGLKVWSSQYHTTLQADLAQTDVIAGARQQVLIEPAKRPSRVAAALHGKLLDASGKPFAAAGYDEAKLYVLYFGASWCGPCRKFAPGLVRLVTGAMKENPHLATVLMSGDEKDEDMLAYMKEEKMPWPAMPLATLRETPLFLSQSAGYIPNLVILDRYGRVLASSSENGQYVGPEKALKALESLLASGAAK
jgi:nucleoredoxin